MSGDSLTDLIPRSELERAVAAVRAEERRKRRRVQLALAVSVGLLVVAGGAFVWWQTERLVRQLDAVKQLEHAEREAAEAERAMLERTKAEKQLALAEWVRLRERQNSQTFEALLAWCERALREGDAAMASVLLEQAESRETESGAENLKDRMARLRADLQLLRELDSVNVAPPPREAKGP